MQLSKYPQLVQNGILNNMEFSDLFMFSFVSEKMKKLIKSSPQMKRFESVNTIRYDHRNGRTIVCIPYRYRHHKILKISEGDEIKNDCFQLNVSGKMIDFRIIYEDKKYYPVAICQPDGCESLISSIHGYFLDFFGNSVKYYWHAFDCKTPIQQLQNFSACISYQYGMPGEDTQLLNMPSFENFFTSSPILKYVNMYILNIREALSPESKFYQAEYLELFQKEPILRAVLRCFQGRQAILRCEKCDFQDVIELVNRWKSGEAFENLELIKIRTSSGHFPQNDILNAIGGKHIDHAKKPAIHTLPKVYFDIAYEREPRTFPITSHTYVVRETDNRVASVSVQSSIFSFGVWDETEEEFLEIME